MEKTLNINEQTVAALGPQGNKDSALKGKTKSPPKSTVVAAPKSGKWSVPILKQGFDLEAAKRQAYILAEGYMNKILALDDMRLEMSNEEGKTVGNVSDIDNGNLVNSYSGKDILKLYAQNVKERGIIVDGNV